MTRFLATRLLVATTTLLATLGACGRGDNARVQAGSTTSATGEVGTGTTTGAQATSGAFFDPNTATREQLLTIPGFNAAAADAVVAGRPYQNMTALDRVLSNAKLSEQQRDTVYTRLWKPIDLNTASAQEIELIPGVGPRMRHEFEEYRPYQSIERFRREIGKYVDKQEVARLERYVTIGGQGR